MRVLLDHSPLTSPGFDRGLGRYTHGLLDAVLEDARIDVQNVVSLSRVGSKFEIRSQDRNVSLYPLSNDIYHSTAPANLPLIKKCKWVCSILDMIPIDLTEYQRFGIQTRLNYKNAMRSDAIIVLSNYTKSRLVQKYNVSPEKIWVHALPLHRNFNKVEIVNTKLAQDSSFILALVDLRIRDPRKRIHWIKQVFSALNEKGIETVVAGRNIDQSSFPNSSLIENPTDEMLGKLLSMARGFYYPSAYEGQGMPPMEALSFGCPVIAYDNTSIREMLGSNAVVLQDPYPWQSSTLTKPLESHHILQVVTIFEEWIAMSNLNFQTYRRELQQDLNFTTSEDFAKFISLVYESIK